MFDILHNPMSPLSSVIYQERNLYTYRDIANVHEHLWHGSSIHFSKQTLWVPDFQITKKLDYFCLVFSLSYKSHVICINLSVNRLLKKIGKVILISTVDI